MEIRKAERRNVWLLVGVCGGTGSGKTFSALRIASGIAAGHPFVGIDTENGRMEHYSDQFSNLFVGQIHAPFRPDKYRQAIIEAADYLEKHKVPEQHRCVIVDSGSHEWYGDGGCLDWHDELMNGDQRKNLSAWIEPKMAHKRMVTALTQAPCHVVICLRAEEKVEAVKSDRGFMQIVPKKSLTGLDGWTPTCEKSLPYEFTLSVLLTPDKPGLPKPIKLPEQLRPFIPLDETLSEKVGKDLVEWASGGTKQAAAPVRKAGVISADEWASINSAAKAAGLTSKDLLRLLKNVCGVERGSEVPSDKVDALIDAISSAAMADDIADDVFGPKVTEGDDD